VRLLGSDAARRFVIPGFVVAFANLLLLGTLIGYVGASRAYSVGIETLFRDHLPAVAAAGLIAMGLAAGFGRRLRSVGEGARVLFYVLIADVIAGFLPILIFNEITRHPDLSRVLITETAGATQLVAAGLGLLIGFGSSVIVRRRGRVEETSIG